MKITVVILLALSCAAMSYPGKVRVAQRLYAERGRHYLVQYLYETDDIEKQPLELTSPKVPEKIHYNAEISVFDVTSGSRTMIGGPFAGLYTILGCIEDAPILLVHQQARKATTLSGIAVYPSHDAYDVLTLPQTTSHPHLIGR
jgi:hypothetical protein